MSGLSFREEDDDDEERVYRVQLGVFQTASLPVSLGNKLNSPCLTRLKTLFRSIYGKIPLKTRHVICHNHTSSIPPSCAAEYVGLYCCACVCVCVFHHALLQMIKKVLLFLNEAGQEFIFVLRYFIKPPWENKRIKNEI